LFTPDTEIIGEPERPVALPVIMPVTTAPFGKLGAPVLPVIVSAVILDIRYLLFVEHQ
jgi:hypothetical protein